MLAFVKTQIREYTKLGEGAVFQTIPEYPEFCWTELIVNAVAHRNYSIKGTDIQIKMSLVPFGLSKPVLFVVASDSAEDLGAILQRLVVVRTACLLKLSLHPDAYFVECIRDPADHVERINADRGAGKALPGQRDVIAMHVTAHELHLLRLA